MRVLIKDLFGSIPRVQLSASTGALQTLLVRIKNTYSKYIHCQILSQMF